MPGTVINFAFITEHIPAILYYIFHKIEQSLGEIMFFF